jgi:hypothetical protein
MFKQLKLKYKLAIYAAFVLGFLLVCMGIALYVLSQKQEALMQVEQQYQEVLKQKKNVETEVEMAATAKNMLLESEQVGLSPAQWTEMRVNVRQKKMNRQELNKLLVEATRAPGNIFGAEKFDISVSNADENLFEPTGNSKQEVLVSLQGKAWVRSDGKVAAK